MASLRMKARGRTGRAAGSCSSRKARKSISAIWSSVRCRRSKLGMGNRKLLAGIIALSAVGLAAAGILISSGPPRRGGSATLPYYKRTGFMSKALLELNTGAKGIESIHLPDGFEIEVAARPGLVTYPMFIAFDDR